MKKIYSIGYKDKYGDFMKVCENGSTKKFETIEDCKEFMKDKRFAIDYKIMVGWKVIEVVKVIA